MNKKIFKKDRHSSRETALEKIKERFSKHGADKCLITFADKTCTVHISKMYHGLGEIVSFANMKWLSELLGTDNINLCNESYTQGCESCDWGSQHTVDFVCKDISI